MIEWPRLCNVIEIRNNEMIQSFLVEMSCNQWFLPKKTFCIRIFSKKKMFFGDLTTIIRITKLTERKVGSVKQHGGL